MFSFCFALLSHSTWLAVNRTMVLKRAGDIRSIKNLRSYDTYHYETRRRLDTREVEEHEDMQMGKGDDI